MYYSPMMTPRREGSITSASTQKILDENVRLIHSIMIHQKSGATKEVHELQRILHKNLTYLATIADQTTNPGQRSAVQGAPVMQQVHQQNQLDSVPHRDTTPSQQLPFAVSANGSLQYQAVGHGGAPPPHAGQIHPLYMRGAANQSSGTNMQHPHVALSGPSGLQASTDYRPYIQARQMQSPNTAYGYPNYVVGQPVRHEEPGPMLNQPRRQPFPQNESRLSEQTYIPPQSVNLQTDMGPSITTSNISCEPKTFQLQNSTSPVSDSTHSPSVSAPQLGNRLSPGPAPNVDGGSDKFNIVAVNQEPSI